MGRAGANQQVGLLRWHSGLLDTVVRIVDGLLCLACVWGTGLLVPFEQPLPHAALATAAAVLALLWVVVLRRLGTYRLARYRRPADAMLDAALALGLLGPLLLGAAELLAAPGWAGRGAILGWAAMLLGVTLVARLVLRGIVRAGLASGLLRRQVAIIGATDVAATVIETLTRDDEPDPVDIIGIYDDRQGTRVAPNVLSGALRGTVADLCEAARGQRVDVIAICLPWSRAMTIFSTIEQVQWITADITVPLDPDSFHPRSARIHSIGGAPALEVMRQPLQGGSFLLKAVEDYAIAAAALVLVAPVLALVALAIRLDSPGPILFRQPREGFNGARFTILKFRTMTVDPEDRGVVGVERDSARITRVGRVLRRYSLDELPQLVNVLRGEMSVVGPRPYVPAMQVGTERFAHAVRDYAVRYRMKPGLTGLAQVSGARGRMHSLLKARRGIELDVAYVEGWSLALDIRILLRTVVVCLLGRDAH